MELGKFFIKSYDKVRKKRSKQFSECIESAGKRMFELFQIEWMKYENDRLKSLVIFGSPFFS